MRQFWHYINEIYLLPNNTGPVKGDLMQQIETSS